MGNVCKFHAEETVSSRVRAPVRRAVTLMWSVLVKINWKSMFFLLLERSYSCVCGCRVLLAQVMRANLLLLRKGGLVYSVVWQQIPANYRQSSNELGCNQGTYVIASLKRPEIYIAVMDFWSQLHIHWRVYFLIYTSKLIHCIRADWVSFFTTELRCVDRI